MPRFGSLRRIEFKIAALPQFFVGNQIGRIDGQNLCEGVWR
jgi:hypothetical protein